MKVEPAGLQDFETDIGEKIRSFSPENISKRERLKNLGTYSEKEEKELLETIVDAIDEAVDQALPFPFGLLITERMIRKLALFVFEYVGEKVIELMPD